MAKWPFNHSIFSFILTVFCVISYNSINQIFILLNFRFEGQWTFSFYYGVFFPRRYVVIGSTLLSFQHFRYKACGTLHSFVWSNLCTGRDKKNCYKIKSSIKLKNWPTVTELLPSNRKMQFFPSEFCSGSIQLLWDEKKRMAQLYSHYIFRRNVH